MSGPRHRRSLARPSAARWRAPWRATVSGVERSYTRPRRPLIRVSQNAAPLRADTVFLSSPLRNLAQVAREVCPSWIRRCDPTITLGRTRQSKSILLSRERDTPSARSIRRHIPDEFRRASSDPAIVKGSDEPTYRCVSIRDLNQLIFLFSRLVSCYLSCHDQ